MFNAFRVNVRRKLMANRTADLLETVSSSRGAGRMSHGRGETRYALGDIPIILEKRREK